MLGVQWRSAPDEIRRPYIEHERLERDKYLANIAEWRNDQREKQQEERKALLSAMPEPVYPGMMFQQQPSQEPYVPINPYAVVHPTYGRPMQTPYGYRTFNNAEVKHPPRALFFIVLYCLPFSYCQPVDTI